MELIINTILMLGCIINATILYLVYKKYELHEVGAKEINKILPRNKFKVVAIKPKNKQRWEEQKIEQNASPALKAWRKLINKK